MESKDTKGRFSGPHEILPRRSRDSKSLIMAFNSNLVGAAREIFSNVRDPQGFEVWRRVMLNINRTGERRRDELSDLIQRPKGVNKCEEVANIIQDWVQIEGCSSKEAETR